MLSKTFLYYLPKESLMDGKITIRVAAIVVDKNKLLLAKHQKGGLTYFVLPGGELEYGEDVMKAAEREVKEETNLVVKAEKIVWIGEFIQKDRHIVDAFVLCKKKSGKLMLGFDPERTNEIVLIEVKFVALSKLRSLKLYPPKIKELLIKRKFPNEIQYLGTYS
jgi:ADP-ribose pyrophosphatase YjhB (NUDIX family)